MLSSGHSCRRVVAAHAVACEHHEFVWVGPNCAVHACRGELAASVCTGKRVERQQLEGWMAMQSCVCNPEGNLGLHAKFACAQIFMSAHHAAWRKPVAPNLGPIAPWLRGACHGFSSVV